MDCGELQELRDREATVLQSMGSQRAGHDWATDRQHMSVWGGRDKVPHTGGLNDRLLLSPSPEARLPKGTEESLLRAVQLPAAPWLVCVQTPPL